MYLLTVAICAWARAALGLGLVSPAKPAKDTYPTR